MRRALSQQTLHRIVDEWNRTVQIGAWVEYVSDPHAPTSRHRTSAPATLLGGHTPVVWLDGVSGCVAISNCTLVRGHHEAAA